MDLASIGSSFCDGLLVAFSYNYEINKEYIQFGRSQWPRGLRHELSSLALKLGSSVRIPLKAWMSVLLYSVSR
jgi:hypothetical protein